MTSQVPDTPSADNTALGEAPDGARAPDHDPSPGPAWRSLVGMAPAAIWAFFWAGVIALVALVAPRFFRRHAAGLVRAWGRPQLALVGLRVEVHGQQNLHLPGPRLVLFNHQSLLDLQVMSSIWPADGVVIYKREFHAIPLVGTALRGAGMISIDRSDPAAARASMDEAARRIREEGASVFISPEGTRSRLGGLQPFKKGAFHLAAGTGVPAQPVIVRGVAELLPMGRLLPRPGCVRIDVLAPLDTSTWSAATVAEHAKDVRRLYLRYLDPSPAPERTP